MTAAYQEALLKYLFQYKEARSHKDLLDINMFDDPTAQIVFEQWHNYVSKYNSIPPKANFLELVDREAKRSKGAVTTEKYNLIRNTITVAYTPIDVDFEFTRDVIKEYARRKGMRNIFTSKADKIKTATVEELDAIGQEMRRVLSIGEDDSEATAPSFLFRDIDKHKVEQIQKAHPTFLHGINKTTAARGFYSPQLILLLGGPKAFKTGTILSILREYARNGLKVFIADAENGAEDIYTRLKQGYMSCEVHELQSYKQELRQALRQIQNYGGDIVVQHFPAYVSTLDTVDASLEILATTEGWVPDVIFYDYLQLFSSSNKKIFDKRLQIQDVYHHAVRLNNKYHMFAFTAAKVPKDAVNSLVIDTKGFAEDFGQAYNCHAAFALCRTLDEVKDGTGRIIPIVQRRGSAYKYGASTTCAVKIDEPTETITELDDVEVYMEMLEESMQSKNKGQAKRKYVAPDTLKDD